MAIRISARSELVHAQLVKILEVTFWGRMEPAVIEPADDDLIYNLRDVDRLDNLSSQFYGDPRLRWVLMRANDMFLEPNDVIPGEDIRVPSFTRLRRQGFVLR